MTPGQNLLTSEVKITGAAPRGELHAWVRWHSHSDRCVGGCVSCTPQQHLCGAAEIPADWPGSPLRGLGGESTPPGHRDQHCCLDLLVLTTDILCDPDPFKMCTDWRGFPALGNSWAKQEALVPEQNVHRSEM